MKELERPSSRRLVSSRTASFESLTDESSFNDQSNGQPKKRDSSWDSKWKQQVASNETPPFIRRIGGSPGRLNNSKWEEKAGSGASSPLTVRRRHFKSPSVERKFLKSPPPLPPSIPETSREYHSNSSSSSESTPPRPPHSAARSDSVPQSPRTVRRKLVIRAAKTPSPIPKEWTNSSSTNTLESRKENEATRTDAIQNTTSLNQQSSHQSTKKTSEEIGLIKESNNLESHSKKSPSTSPRHTGTFTAVPVMVVSDEEASLNRNSSMKRSSPEKKKFLNSMLNQSEEKSESHTGERYKTLGDMRSEQREEKRSESYTSQSWTTNTVEQHESKSYSSTLQQTTSSSSQQFHQSENVQHKGHHRFQTESKNQQEFHTASSTTTSKGSQNEELHRKKNSSFKDQNNNDIPQMNSRPGLRRDSPKKSPSPSEHVLTSLEKLVKETENMINKHLDTEEDNIVRPSEATPPPVPPPRSASINKVPLPDKTDGSSIPPPPPPPPPPAPAKAKGPLRSFREPSPSSIMSDEVLNTARELQQQTFDKNEDELHKAEKILEQRRNMQEEKLLKKRLQEQKIKKEEMFRYKKEKEKYGPPADDTESLDSLIFQGSPPRPIRHTPTSQLYTDAPSIDYGRPAMAKLPVKHLPSKTTHHHNGHRDDNSSLREEIQNAQSSSVQRMRALKDVEKRDLERMNELRRSMIEDQMDSFVPEESFPLPPPPQNLMEEKKHSDPRFVVLKDPSIPSEHEDHHPEDDELLKAEEKELEALRSAGQKERELLEEMEKRKREIEAEIAKERKRIEELYRIENEKRQKCLSLKRNQKHTPPKAVQQYEEMVARKMNLDRSSSTPTPPPPPPATDSGELPQHSGPYESSELDEETDTEGYGDEDYSLGMDIPYADYSSNNATPTPTTGEMEDLPQESESFPPPPSPPLQPPAGNLRSLLRSRSSVPFSSSHEEEGSRKVHFSEIDQVKVLSLESLLSTINSETSEPIYSNIPVKIETAFNQSRNYYQVRPPYRNQVV